MKAVVRLRRRRERDRTGLFPIEGFRELRRALEARVAIRELYYCRELFLGTNEDEVLAAASGAELIETSDAAFRRMSYRDRPEGLLAVAECFATDLARIRLGSRPLVLVVESIEKPGNLGTMLRAATAAGADAVIVCDPTTDPFNPNVIRASLGTVFVSPLAVTTTAEAIEWLRGHDVRIIAGVPDGKTDVWDTDLTGSVALGVGSEQYGLSDAWRSACDVAVRIPMPGPMDSLNAATAAAVLLFEGVRQRTRP